MYTENQISEVTAAAIEACNSDGGLHERAELRALLDVYGTDILYHCPVYVISVNLPGCTPDNPPYAVATAEDAAACLADELQQTADAHELDSVPPSVSADAIKRHPVNIEYGGYVHSCVACDASYIIPDNC